MAPIDTSQTTHHEQNLYRAALRSLRPVVIAVLGFSAIINALMLTGSIYMLQVYDRVLSSGSIPTLLGLFTIVVIFYGFLGLYDFLRARMLSRAAMRLDKRISVKSYDRWLRSGLLDGDAHGDTQPLRDIEIIRGIIASPAMNALFDLPFVPLFLAVLFIIHPWLGMLTIAGATVVALVAVLNRAITHKAIGKNAALSSVESNFSEVSRRNAESILAMGMQDVITARWQGLHESTLANVQSGSDPSEGIAAASRAFRMLLQSAMLTLGAFLVLRGEITAGMIIASSILSGRALAPLDQLIGQWRTIGRALAAHQRLQHSFSAKKPETKRIKLPSPSGQITVKGLTKLGAERVGSDRQQILSNVSFSLKPGDGLGIIGNSASGKSTLARLLVGAGQADKGEVRLDGATLGQWEPSRLGRAIGYLPQNLEMLPGSIRDNISRFDPTAKDEDVMAAARLTGVHNIILGLEFGYGTILGAAGEPSPLSGGQIQRLGLARAVYGMPAVVVLDEPNSNLDVAGDEALTKTIAALRKAGSSVIVMAHRPSALAALNKLLVLDAGTVQKIGEKDDILGKNAVTKNAKPKITAVPSPAPPGKAIPSNPDTTPRLMSSNPSTVVPSRARGSQVIRQAGPFKMRTRA